MCFDCSKIKTVLLCGFIPYMCFSLKLFPLMYWLEIQDVLFLLKHIKLPADNFNIFMTTCHSFHPALVNQLGKI